MAPWPRRRWLALTAALAASIGPATLAAGSTRRSATPPILQVPPLAPVVWTLANGLQVILLPESSASGASPGAGGGGGSGLVSVQVWYRVGGKDDPPGRSGFAHLFEHMMFKGTRHLANEQFDRLTEDVGGQNNAFTAEDVTVYHADVPANHLERLLWAEAERMGNLNVDQANFDSERSVVKEELRQRVLADPYGRLFNGLAPAFWQRHPYRRPVIGSIDDLDAASLDDVRRFHATYYRPDNAVLIVAGDFDGATARGWIERYFAPLTRPASPVPRVRVKEPRRTAPARVDLRAPQVPLPAVALLWQGPPAGHPDGAALQIAAALLSGGESARLHEALVYRERIAQSVGFGADALVDGGMLSAWAIAAGGAGGASTTALDPLVRALRREVDRLARGPITAAELDKVRSALVTEALASRQTPHGRAQTAGWALIQRGDARAADRELAELQAVRAVDVQRVLTAWIAGGHPVTVTYTQAPGGAPTGAKEPR
jgi:zinc protease